LDSLVALKFLGVVYSAHPDTRELGRYCFFKLLDATPEADLLELYVGEEVGNLFDQVRREHAMARARNLAVKEVALEAQEASPTSIQNPYLVASLVASPQGQGLALASPSGAQASLKPFWRPYVWPAAIAAFAVGFILLNRDSESSSNPPTSAALTRP
jgi:hypothetical protein